MGDDNAATATPPLIIVTGVTYSFTNSLEHSCVKVDSNEYKLRSFLLLQSGIHVLLRLLLETTSYLTDSERYVSVEIIYCTPLCYMPLVISTPVF